MGEHRGIEVAIRGSPSLALARCPMATLKSGEGFVMEFQGPGRILTQTRNPGTLVSWLTTELPFSRD